MAKQETVVEMVVAVLREKGTSVHPSEVYAELKGEGVSLREYREAFQLLLLGNKIELRDGAKRIALA